MLGQCHRERGGFLVSQQRLARGIAVDVHEIYRSDFGLEAVGNQLRKVAKVVAGNNGHIIDAEVGRLQPSVTNRFNGGHDRRQRVAHATKLRIFDWI